MAQIEAIEARVQEVMRRVLHLPELSIHRALTAKDVVEWDSMAHINLIIEIEREFSMHFDLDELESMQNVGALIDVIAQRTP